MACCAQHLTGDEWSSFLLAHRGALWARQLRTWARHVGNLVSSVPPQFQRCELTATPVASRATSSCVGPHCQCLAVQEFCERHALQGEAFHEQLKARRASIRLPKPGRPGEFWESVKVPLWVVSSSATRAVRAEGRETQGLFSVPPRVGRRENKDVSQARIPLAIRQGMFRAGIRSFAGQGPCGHAITSRLGRRTRYDGGAKAWQPNPEVLPQRIWPGSCPCSWQSRCEVSSVVYEVHDAIDAGCVQAQRLLEKLRCDLAAVLGRVGVSESMNELVEAASVCWDWSYLVRSMPTAKHVQSFLLVFRALREFLEHTLWPSDEQFRVVKRTWAFSDVDICKQYLILMRRVRNKFTHHAMDWSDTIAYEVEPLWCFSMIRRLVQRVASRLGCHPLRDMEHRFYKSHDIACTRVATLVSQFIGSFAGVHLPAGALTSFIARPGMLRPMQYLQRRLRKKMRCDGNPLRGRGWSPAWLYVSTKLLLTGRLCITFYLPNVSRKRSTVRA